MGTFQRHAAALLPVLLAWGAVGCSKDVKIGALISDSGAVATYGKKVRKGLDLALEEINAKGGLQGGTIELIYRDDATNAEAGRQAIEHLIERDGVRVVIGAVSSPVTLAVAPICEKKRVVLLSPSASAPGVTKTGSYIFRNYPSDVLEGTAMADFAKELGLERVAIFSLDNEFGSGLREVFTRGFESKFRKVVKTFEFPADGVSADDFAAMVKEAKALDPDGIYIVAYLEEQAELLKQIRKAGLTAICMGTSASSPPEDLVRLAGPAADRLVFPSSLELDSKEHSVASFVVAYRERYGEEPDIYAAHGYDALKLVVLAMERTGSAHPDDIKRGLLGIEDYHGAAGRTGFDENGDVVRYPRLFVIHDRTPMPYERFVEEGGRLRLASKS